MLKKIFTVLRKIVFSVLLLYGYNLIVSPLNLIIPINFITVSLITIFGSSALIGLIVILLTVF